MQADIKNTDSSDDYDSPWKELPEEYFREFAEFFFPDMAEGADWEKGYEFLDKELQQAVRDAELGKRLADKLVKLRRRDGGEAWVLAHVEIQGQEKSDFAERMFVYNYRIFDRYHKPAGSFAVLADGASRMATGPLRIQSVGKRDGHPFSDCETERLAGPAGGTGKKRQSFCPCRGRTSENAGNPARPGRTEKMETAPDKTALRERDATERYYKPFPIR